VTEPVARASARRTVRVAVALVAGQAALCAVIGWVTLGGPHTAGLPAPNPLAGGPLVVPPLTVAPAPPTSVPTAPRTSVRPAPTSAPPAPLPPPVIVPAGATSTRPPTSTAPQPHPPIPPAPMPVTAAKTPPVAPTVLASPSSDSNLAPTPTPTASDIQQGVVVGDPCDPVGAAGTTVDGTPVLCVLGDDGVQRWQIM
jgi:hypothetical protein